MGFRVPVYKNKKFKAQRFCVSTLAVASKVSSSSPPWPATTLTPSFPASTPSIANLWVYVCARACVCERVRACVCVCVCVCVCACV
jgi:hypothetical protein